MSQETGLHLQGARFQTPLLSKSLCQVLTSFGGFLITCATIYALIGNSHWSALALTPLAAGFLVRIFIIQHDCGHFSFFKGRRANNVLGFICSLLTLAPYASWRRQHAGHHATWNDLDRRQRGLDIYSSCMTVSEYLALSPMCRLRYKVLLHPFVANILLPPLVFLVLYRTPFDAPKTWRHERHAVHVTNLALILLYGGLGMAVGFGHMAAVQLLIMVQASIIGVWLFSIQHRFEKTLWMRHGDWKFSTAAIFGSSYLRLPGLLNWFTGNIGLHHIHHLNSRIPNYHLRACHDSIPEADIAPKLSLRDGLLALHFVLWDERLGRMVTFSQATASEAAS
jgi:omega-6 fatty acid desaturase (delta-12 desaturase)